MNKEQLQSQWEQVKGKIKQKWGKITDDELKQVEGKYDELSGLLQKHYQMSKEEAEKQLKDLH